MSQLRLVSDSREMRDQIGKTFGLTFQNRFRGYAAKNWRTTFDGVKFKSNEDELSTNPAEHLQALAKLSPELIKGPHVMLCNAKSPLVTMRNDDKHFGMKICDAACAPDDLGEGNLVIKDMVVEEVLLVMNGKSAEEAIEMAAEGEDEDEAGNGDDEADRQWRRG